MQKKPPQGLFITGTNTEVGKTYVGALIIRALTATGKRVGAYKPVASGCDVVDGKLLSEDAETLRAALELDVPIERVCPQMFQAPLAPHLAAHAEDKQVDSQLLRSGVEAWADECDILVVEGAGGLMSPISDEDYVADLAHDLGYPLIVVAPNSLGVINQTLQTLITAATFREGLEIAGVILNDQQPTDGDDRSQSSNFSQLQQHCVPPVLDHVTYNASDLKADVDWNELLLD